MTVPSQTDRVASLRYLLLADISGYTAFLNGVEGAHGVDFSSGIPAGYEVLGDLLDSVVEGVQPAFAIAKLEGDAVFAVAPAEDLEGQGKRCSIGSEPSTAPSTSCVRSGRRAPRTTSAQAVLSSGV